MSDKRSFEAQLYRTRQSVEWLEQQSPARRADVREAQALLVRNLIRGEERRLATVLGWSRVTEAAINEAWSLLLRLARQKTRHLEA